MDAPLDDANVDAAARGRRDRRKLRTRFLNHHPHRLTMARMDRLFGAHMAERGVSQLVSVDLRRAERCGQRRDSFKRLDLAPAAALTGPR